MNNLQISDGIGLLYVAVKEPLLYEPLVSHPEDEIAALLVRELSQLARADAGIGRGLLKGQIAFFPDGNVLCHRHYLLYLLTVLPSRAALRP